VAAMQRENYQLITVHGLVVPVVWDDNGNPMTLSIATFNEDEYIIEDKKASEGLQDFLGQEVLVSGSVEEIGKKKILKHCSILKIKPFSVHSLTNGGFILADAVILLALLSIFFCFVYLV
jgi:hypothetical protein